MVRCGATSDGQGKCGEWGGASDVCEMGSGVVGCVIEATQC